MSWPKHWNEAARRRIATLEGKTPSRMWSLLGMLALGLVVGAAIGGYAVWQRPQMKQLARYAGRMRDDFADIGDSAVKPDAVGSARLSNHRRKATAEV
jgi:hypothetical protein